VQGDEEGVSQSEEHVLIPPTQTEAELLLEYIVDIARLFQGNEASIVHSEDTNSEEASQRASQVASQGASQLQSVSVNGASPSIEINDPVSNYTRASRNNQQLPRNGDALVDGNKRHNTI
jgi:hypothetical protein